MSIIVRPSGAASGGATDPEVVRDTIAAALVAGSNVTIAPNDAANTITISAAGGTGSTSMLNVRDYGATGNGTTDDTTAINAAMSAARVVNSKRGAVVYVPKGVYQVSAPINLYDNVHVIGDSSYFDPTFYNASILRATSGFTGSAILLQNPDGNTVSDPTPRPDESYHFGLVEKICFMGNGIAGPHGIDPGWNGEGTTIRGCSAWNCNSGIYLNNTQASGNIEHFSAFNCNYALNCDDIFGAVRVFAISGDNNTSLIRLKGGRSANLSVYGMKAENYLSGKGDPVIDIVDLAGGAFTLIGGWADTASARTRVIRISQPGGSTQRPKLFIAGFDHNSLYTNLIEDTLDGLTIPAGYGSGYPVIAYNGNMGVIGGTLGIGYGRSITGTQFGGASTMPLVSSGPDNGTVFHAGTGTTGGRLMNTAGDATSIQWRASGGNNLGFFGATPVTKPAVTGAKGGNAALTSLLTQLAALGLITDSTT